METVAIGAVILIVVSFNIGAAFGYRKGVRHIVRTLGVPKGYTIDGVHFRKL